MANQAIHSTLLNKQLEKSSPMISRTPSLTVNQFQQSSTEISCMQFSALTDKQYLLLINNSTESIVLNEPHETALLNKENNNNNNNNNEGHKLQTTLSKTKRRRTNVPRGIRVIFFFYFSFVAFY